MTRLTLRLLLTGVLLAGAGCSAVSVESRASRIARDLEQAQQARKAAEKLSTGLELAADGKYQEAINALFPLVRQFDSLGDRARAAAAVFWTAYCHEKLDRWADAESFYQMTVTKYAGTPAAREAADRLAQRLQHPMP